MAKTIENTRIKKLPTSQLIFYMGSPNLHDEALRNKIDEAVFKRLTKKYKLYPSAAMDFVDREQKIIDNRGYNLENFAFGNDIPYAELIRIFYANIDYPLLSYLAFNYNNLTLSEVVQFSVWFNFYKCRFEERNKGFEHLLTNLEKSQGRVLNNRDPFTEKYDKASELDSLRTVNEKRQLSEIRLINYNRMYADDLIDKSKQILDCGTEFRTLISLLRESFLVSQSSSEELEQYRDLNFDAYSEYASIPSELEIPDFPLIRKR